MNNSRYFESMVCLFVNASLCVCLVEATMRATVHCVILLPRAMMCCHWLLPSSPPAVFFSALPPSSLPVSLTTFLPSSLPSFLPSSCQARSLAIPLHRLPRREEPHHHSYFLCQEGISSDNECTHCLL